MTELPVHRIRGAFLDALSRGPVVLSSPTGSGKSTEVPRWCEGRVLVVEPRRIACRSLAARVAELEGTRVGEGVGYVVRDERAMGEDTRIVFATPGMVLRDRRLLESARTLVLDEMHERSLEVDLLLALLVHSGRGPLVVMSATLEGERVATHVSGTHISAEGRAYPVETRYLAGASVQPDAEELPLRVRRALDAAAADPGDVLVFLPGKAEIDACAQALRDRDLAVVPLHGGLGLDEQRRAFERAPRRKVILATNVAETSLTIPGIGVVIDSGLVRRTRYHDGRGYLALAPIAEDSAAQRAGRAGRTAAGVCYRLWSQAARLEPTTPPAIHRESLVPLVIGAAAFGARPEALPFLDPPRAYALEAARADLRAWGALDEEAASLTASGRALYALPLDPAHARLLIAARDEGCLEDAIDLVAVLSVERPLFVGDAGSTQDDDDDLRASGCDATALVRALRERRPGDRGISPVALGEALLARARLRRAEELDDTRPVPGAIDREAILRAAIAADRRLVHIARARGRSLYFSNGGTELELGRESAVQRLRDVAALVVLGTRALGAGRDARVIITCGMALPLASVARAGLGEDRIGAVSIESGRVVASIERVLAGRVVSTREESPTGALAREALVTLLERGSLFRAAVATTRERLERTALAAKLAARGHAAIHGVPPGPTELGPWLLTRLTTLGVESGDDLAMLSAGDFLAPELPPDVQATLDRELPATVSVGDAIYRAEYDLDAAQVVLHMVKGSRREPPPLAYLPKLTGLRVCVASRGGVAVLRERGR